MGKENKINYEALEEITVKSQEELDMIPDGFKGIIYIEFGIRLNRAVLTRTFPRRVVARGNSSVEAWENASVVAGGNVQVVEGSERARIQISGNARIVYYPKNIEDFMNFYGIKHDKKTAIFYKAVHRVPNTCRDTNAQDGSEIKCVPPDYRYVSDHDNNFEYFIGEVIREDCDQDITEDCSYGIHISHMNWALQFGGGNENK